jgi:hypothetical protein
MPPSSVGRAGRGAVPVLHYLPRHPAPHTILRSPTFPSRSFRCASRRSPTRPAWPGVCLQCCSRRRHQWMMIGGSPVSPRPPPGPSWPGRRFFARCRTWTHSGRRCAGFPRGRTTSALPTTRRTPNGSSAASGVSGWTRASSTSTSSSPRRWSGWWNWSRRRASWRGWRNRHSPPTRPAGRSGNSCRRITPIPSTAMSRPPSFTSIAACRTTTRSWSVAGSRSAARL